MTHFVLKGPSDSCCCVTEQTCLVTAEDLLLFVRRINAINFLCSHMFDWHVCWLWTPSNSHLNLISPFLPSAHSILVSERWICMNRESEAVSERCLLVSSPHSWLWLARAATRLSQQPYYPDTVQNSESDECILCNTFVTAAQERGRGGLLLFYYCDL